jgi:hypothetical protein
MKRIYLFVILFALSANLFSQNDSISYHTAFLQNLKIDRDDIFELTQFSDPNAAYYKNMYGSHLYIKQLDNGSINIVLELQHLTRNMLMLEKFIVMDNDKNKMDFVCGNNCKSKVLSGQYAIYTLEYFGFSLRDKEILFLQNIVDSGGGVIRAIGRDNYVDRKITKNELKTYRKILDTYYALVWLSKRN